MTSWDPAQYRKFSGHRMRPALDLLAAVPLDAPESIVDLGCGEGRVTKLLAGRWPNAAIVGIDDSAAMLEVASREVASREVASREVPAREVPALTWPRVTWIQSDVATWRPAAPVDLVFSNAALHWLPDHATLFPDLIRFLRPGGVLAVQMPRNFDAPSHTAIHEAAAAGPWRERLAGLVRNTEELVRTTPDLGGAHEKLVPPTPVARPEDYHHWLSPHAAMLDIWETTYLQQLEGDNPVAEWTKGTWLKPFLDALDGADRTAFEADYRARVAAAYPRNADGPTLFPFRRIFVVARAAG